MDKSIHSHPSTTRKYKISQIPTKNASSRQLKSTNFGGLRNYQIMILFTMYLHGSLALRYNFMIKLKNNFLKTSNTLIQVSFKGMFKK